MATLLAASIGTGIVGALVTGWLKQRNEEDVSWDPNRFSLDDHPATVEQAPAPQPVVPSQEGLPPPHQRLPNRR